MANRARIAVPGHEADSRVPRYLQVASALRRRIRDGRWAVGDRIATLEELEREFDVARVTVRQAIELLQSEGLLKSHQGRGTFVTKTVEHDRWLQLATDWESLIAPIRDHVPQQLPAEAGTAPRIGEDDGVAAPAYVAIRSVQKRDSKPYAYARVHVAKHVHARASGDASTASAVIRPSRSFRGVAASRRSRTCRSTRSSTPLTRAASASGSAPSRSTSRTRNASTA